MEDLDVGPGRELDRVGVTVIVVNFETGHLLRDCITAYTAQDHPRIRVVVVDNASRDGSAAILDELEHAGHRHPVQVVRSPTNRGFAGAINDALGLTDDPVVVFSNVDVAPEPELVSRAVAALVAEPARGSVQPLLLRARSGRIVDTTGHVIDRARLVHNRGQGESSSGQFAAGEIFGVSGALAVHRRTMLDDVAWSPGGEVLTEDLFAYFDDVDLDWRARRFGWSAWFEPTAVGRHERGGRGARRSRRVEALNQANRLLVVLSCDDLRDVARHLPAVVGVTVVKLFAVMLTRPSALPAVAGRLARGLPGAIRRRRELDRRARVDAATVAARWLVPFEPRQWISRWRSTAT